MIFLWLFREMILNLLSTANFYITISNRTAWFDIRTFHWFYIFQGIFIRSRKRLNWILIFKFRHLWTRFPLNKSYLLSWVNYIIAKWIIINFDHTVFSLHFQAHPPSIHDIYFYTFKSSICSQFVRSLFTFADDFNVLGLGMLYLCKSIIDAN